MAPHALLNNPQAFYDAFLSALRRNGHPMYPDRKWWQSLEIAVEADEGALRASERHRCDAAVYERRYEQWLAPAGRSRQARELEERCDAFLASRGLPTSDFHAY